MNRKKLCLLTTATLLFGLVTQISAYEFYPTTSGGSRGSIEIECLNLPRSDIKTSIVYTYGFDKPIGAYAYTKIYYSNTPAGTILSHAKSNYHDYNAKVELKSKGKYPIKADYKNSCKSNYYGSYSTTETMNFK